MVQMAGKYLLFLFCCIKGTALATYSCLTWTLNHEKLQLICRVQNYISPISFIDSFGQEQAKCDFVRNRFNCKTKLQTGHTVMNSSIFQVTLTITDVQQNRINGQWTCAQDANEFSTTVSTSRGILDSTDVHLNAELLNTTPFMKFKLKCYSCREPRRGNVEFQINNRSEDYLTFDHLNGKCFHEKGECYPDICSCSPSGTEYTRIFVLPRNNQGIHFSCEMTFNDDFKSAKFSILSTVFFNGTDFIHSGTTKTITKHPESEIDEGNGTVSETVTIAVDHDKNNSKDTVTAVAITLAAGALILGMVIIVFVKYRKEEGKGEVNTDHDLVESEREVNSENARLLEDCDTEFKTTTTELPRTKFCQPCLLHDEKVTANYTCVECNELLCSLCKDSHMRMKMARNHTLVEIRTSDQNDQLLKDYCRQRGNSAPAILERKSTFICPN